VRVLYVTPRFFPDSGGVELHVAEVARRLANGGDSVTVLTTDRTGKLPPAETLDGVEIRRVRAYPSGRDYYFAPGLLRAVERGRWDVVHVQSFHTAVAPVAMIAALRARLPYVVTFHGGGHSSRLRSGLRRVQLAALRPLLARAASLVVVAEFESAHYAERLRLPRDRFVLIPNGADLPAVDAPPRTPGAPLLIASIGRLERYKGHQHVIAALPAILRRRPDARLWIAGSGPYESELRRLAANLGIADLVEIRAIAPHDREAMARELARVDVAVLASEFETQPLAAIEAAASGCRVVVADSPGLRELAERGLARIAKPLGDPETLARVVLEESERPADPVPFRLPTWDDCAARLRALYGHVVALDARAPALYF
jgi:glycosyltransferase involved in cell wall biosynthesis